MESLRQAWATYVERPCLKERVWGVGKGKKGGKGEAMEEETGERKEKEAKGEKGSERKRKKGGAKQMTQWIRALAA